ncbi:MAG: putative bifunctional diguanylate cyclase/phosphodiesterase [Gemmatimonadota bacterium]
MQRETTAAPGAPNQGQRASNLKVLFLHSTVGRRLFALFLLAALVPAAILGLSFLPRMSKPAPETDNAEMARAAHDFGALTLERLGRINAELKAFDRKPGVDATDRWPAPGEIGREVSAVALLDRDGRILRARGPLPETAILRRLAADVGATRPTLRFDSTPTSATLLIARRSTASGGRVATIAVVDPRLLWERPDQDAGPITFCVSAGGGAAPYCRKPGLDLSATELERLKQEGRALTVALPMQDAFESNDWGVTAVRSSQSVPPEGQSFGIDLFVAATVAVFLALILSLSQMRRTLVPLERFLLGALGIAERDFSVRINASTQDEFGRVAQAFNLMAERLGLHFRTMQTFSEIDKTILMSPDIGKAGKLALDALKDITGADLVSLGVAEPGSPGQLLIYSFNAAGTELAPSTAIAWNPDPKNFAGPAAVWDWDAHPILPNGYLPALRRAIAATYMVHPIVRNRRAWGLIVLGHAEPIALSPQRRALIRDISDRLAVALSTAERDRRLHVMAHLDALTGLPNRQHLLTILDQELLQAQATGSRAAVLFIDLDRFKETNDTLGHAAGDTLLKRASERIRSSVRECDQVGRHGGDEFTVILNGINSAKDVAYVARKLVKTMSKPFDVEGHSVYAGASVGIAIYPDDGTAGAELVKKADTAMYRAKENGRGRYAFFEQTMNVEMNRRVTLDRELRQAIENNQFELYYQPQFELATGRICGAEALLRWRNPTRGLLAPSTFIELAEETGLIEQLGAWVLREACAQHGRWKADGIRIPRVAVNVSSRQLRQPNFVPSVYYAMSSTHMEPDSLEIEVTESLIIDGGEAAIDALRALEKAAARVAIDDFGTGYSSFTYLKTLPASILKLDKSFMVNVTTDKDAATIAAAIINMAHTLRKEVVAEGVENAGQLDFLRAAGCEKVQGHFLSPALPPQKLAELARLSEREGLSAVLETTRMRMNRIAVRAALKRAHEVEAG